MDISKVSVRRLPVSEPPLPPDGGRVISRSGELAQVVNGESFRFLAYIDFQPDESAPRGNHFHAHKTEILYILSGKLRARYLDLETEESIEILLEAGDLVRVAPNCAHVYYALEYSQAVEFSPDPYDPTDTIRINFDELSSSRPSSGQQ